MPKKLAQKILSISPVAAISTDQGATQANEGGAGIKISLHV